MVGDIYHVFFLRDADSMYFVAEVLVPPLVRVFRSHHIPTILRTSALSLLSESVKANSLAFIPYAVDLSEAMIDLLQIESLPEITKLHMQQTEEEAETQLQGTMAFQPVSTDPKLPPLRRAALHFLAQLFRASTAGIYDSGYQGHLLLGSQAKRMKTTLAYIASTDKDNVMRVMAREAIAEIDQLTEAIVELYFKK